VSCGFGERVYDFHGLNIAVRACGDTSLLLQQRFRRFPQSLAARPDLIFEFHALEPTEGFSFEKPDGPLRQVYELPNGEALYSPKQRQLYLDLRGRVRVLSDLKVGLTQIHLLQPEAEEHWAATHLLFMLSLVEQLKRMGLFNLHAAGVARHGRSVLMPGGSGSGKSTLSLALMKAGLDYLADDMIFLKSSDASVRALAFPEDIDVSTDSLKLLGHPDGLGDAPLSCVARKHSIAFDECFAAKVAWDTRPVALVFPHIAHTASSDLQPMNVSESFLELARSVLLTDSAACQQHLKVLSELAESSPSYRLALGRDFDALRSSIEKLLAS
jgi:hypothetical protein